MLNPSFDVALARTEGAGWNEVTRQYLKTQAKPQGFKHRLGSAESPAEARRWGALQGTLTERPAFDFDSAFIIY